MTGWRLVGALLLALAVVSLAGGAIAVPSLGGALAQDRGSQRVAFSGYDWVVKSSRRPVGPGPNVFREENVEVDSSGRLHLAIVRRGDTWTSAEIGSRRRFGYGTYRFTVAAVSRDPHAILGLFTWDDAGSGESRREIDIEIGRWGDPDGLNAQCVVQPSGTPGNMIRFEMPDGPAVHEFTWSRNGISCSSRLAGPTEEAASPPFVHQAVLGGAPPPAGTANVRITLWLADGRPPSQDGVLRAIVERFEFVPAR